MSGHSGAADISRTGESCQEVAVTRGTGPTAFRSAQAVEQQPIRHSRNHAQIVGKPMALSMENAKANAQMA